MKITIEEDSRDFVTVTREEHAQASVMVVPEAIDGGGPPQDLLQMLAGESGEEEELGGEGEISIDPENAGAAPEWLVEIIQGTRAKPENSPED
ncbi:MAG: hypothetical protein OEZ03_00665 [Alphaproteobacteria bacterium]|nr:hypothetical protein [Alphaproteobacteria bacterium]